MAVGDAVRNMTGSGNVYIVLMILGGLAIVYLLAPFLDNLLQKGVRTG